MHREVTSSLHPAPGYRKQTDDDHGRAAAMRKFVRKGIYLH